MPTTERLQRYAVVIIGLALLLKLVALLVWRVHLDTNYYLNIASNFIERGGLTPYMWRVPPEANIVAGSGTGYGILIQTYWLKAFGLNLISGRVLSYLASALALVPMYFTVRRWWDAPTALVSVTLAAVSVTFLVLLTMRMDALGMLGYSTVLLVHVYAVASGRWWLHALAGVLAIAVTELHILGTVYVFGLAFYYAVDFLRTAWAQRGIPWRHGAWFYYGGAFVAGLVYIWLRILPNPDDYFLISSLCLYCEPASLSNEAVRYVVALARRPVEMGLLIVAVYTALRRRTPQDVHYLLLVAGCVLALGIISPPLLPVYTSHLWAVIMLGVGAAFTHGRGAALKLPRWRLRAIGGLAALVLAVYSVQIVRLATAPNPPDPRIAYVQEHLPSDAVIAGNDSLYHHLLDYPLYLSNGEEFGLIVSTTLRGERGADVWERERPDAVLLDFDNATSQIEPEHVDSLRAYIVDNGFVEVVPGLWIPPELEGRAAVE